MKKFLLALAIITLIGCDPYPVQSATSEQQTQSSTDSPVTSTEQSTTSANVEKDAEDDNEIQLAPQTKEQKKEATLVDYQAQENIRVSDKEVIIAKGRNNNVQTVKRVDDIDAVCWVVMNTNSWEGSISCIPRSQLILSNLQPLTKPEQNNTPK